MKRLILLQLISYSCFSQNYTYFAGSRSSSLAHSSVSLIDIWSSFHNQAALAFLEKDQIAISYQNRYGLKDLSSNYLSYAKRLSIGVLGINVSHFGFDQFNQTKFGLSYSRKFGNTWSMGAQINYENQFIGDRGNQGIFTGEIGLFTKPLKNLQLGFHLYNPLNQDWENQLEFTNRLGFRFGGNYQFKSKSILCAEIIKWADLKERYSLGFEYPLLKFLVLRTGFSFQPNSQNIGFGLIFHKLQIDSSIEYSSFLGSSFNLSLTYEL